MKKNTPSKTICWSCINAVPDNKGHGCSWSRNLEPVEGWTAKQGVAKYQSDGEGDKSSYTVIECPEYERG